MYIHQFENKNNLKRNKKRVTPLPKGDYEYISFDMEMKNSSKYLVEFNINIIISNLNAENTN